MPKSSLRIFWQVFCIARMKKERKNGRPGQSAVVNDSLRTMNRKKSSNERFSSRLFCRLCTLTARKQRLLMLPALFQQHHQKFAVSTRERQGTDVTLDDVKKSSLIGQWNNSFLLAVSKGKLICMDQHAVHERIRLEHLLANVKSYATRESLPHPAPIIHRDFVQRVIAQRTVLKSWGWSFHEAHECLVMETFPAFTVENITCRLSCVSQLYAFVESLETSGASLLTIPPALHKFLVSRSCRGAIMFGDHPSGPRLLLLSFRICLTHHSILFVHMGENL